MSSAGRAGCAALLHVLKIRSVHDICTSALRRGSQENVVSSVFARSGFGGADKSFLSSVSALASSFPPQYEVKEERIVKGYRVPESAKFAVVEVGGTQYKVIPDDVIITEKLKSVDVNDILELRRVLLLGSASETVIGRPYIPGVVVKAAVEEQFLDGKVLIFRKRRRKNSRRLNGHRQPLTTLRILSIDENETEEIRESDNDADQNS